MAAGFPHAFFTRRGGVSEGPYASLNFSDTVGDSTEHVRTNFERAALALGVPAGSIRVLTQVHGAEVVELTGSAPGDEVTRAQGDALISAGAAVCGVRTADCVPVLFGCERTGWVGAVHAGWRGCVAGIVPETVRVLRARGASRLLAAIGPHISVDAFDVSEDVAGQLSRASPDATVAVRSRSGVRIDLRRAIRAQLLYAGLQDDDIDDVLGCTVLQPSLFFSYRREGAVTGRMLSVITGRGPE